MLGTTLGGADDHLYGFTDLWRTKNFFYCQKSGTNFPPARLHFASIGLGNWPSAPTRRCPGKAANTTKPKKLLQIWLEPWTWCESPPGQAYFIAVIEKIGHIPAPKRRSVYILLCNSQHQDSRCSLFCVVYGSIVATAAPFFFSLGRHGAKKKVVMLQRKPNICSYSMGNNSRRRRPPPTADLSRMDTLCTSWSLWCKSCVLPNMYA